MGLYIQNMCRNDIFVIIQVGIEYDNYVYMSSDHHHTDIYVQICIYDT